MFCDYRYSEAPIGEIMFDLNESQRYVHEYEELLKKPGYSPTPAMKQRYEEEKAAVGSSTQSTTSEADSPYAQSTDWGNIWPGGIVWAMPKAGPADWVDDTVGWSYMRSPNPKTGEMEPVVPGPYVQLYPRWETPAAEFVWKNPYDEKEQRQETALAKLSQWWENFQAGNCD